MTRLMKAVLPLGTLPQGDGKASRGATRRVAWFDSTCFSIMFTWHLTNPCLRPSLTERTSAVWRWKFTELDMCIYIVCIYIYNNHKVFLCFSSVIWIKTDQSYYSKLCGKAMQLDGTCLCIMVSKPSRIVWLHVTWYDLINATAPANHLWWLLVE